MHIQTQRDEMLIHKIHSLSPDKMVEVEDFVDFLFKKQETRLLIQAASILAESSFAKVWNNIEDAEYDRL